MRSELRFRFCTPPGALADLFPELASASAKPVETILRPAAEIATTEVATEGLWTGRERWPVDPDLPRVAKLVNSSSSSRKSSDKSND